MAYCETVQIPGGGTAIVRLSGKRPALCEVCNLRRHTRLCDALEPGQASRNKTCDIKLCEGCTTSSGKQDFCPKHKELA